MKIINFSLLFLVQIFLPNLSVADNRPSNLEGQTLKINQSYTLEDLKILAKERNFNEFFKHSQDVRPTLRNNQWKTMVKEMAVGLTDRLVKEKNIGKEDFEFVESIFEFPLLKNHLPFLLNRADIGVEYFKSCFEKQNKENWPYQSCLSLIEKFWQKSPILEHIGVQLGELILEYSKERHPLKHFQYFEKAISSPNMAGLCRKKSVQKILLTHFMNYKETHPFKKSFKREMRRIASKECLNELHGNLREILNTSQDPELVETAYQFLCGLNQCQKDEFNTFLLSYLLSGPSVGVIFNHSWNLVTKMGKDHRLRKKLLGEMKKLDPLPGKIFALMDQKRKNIILDHLAKNFPEYMDFYAETCLKFLEGKGAFKNGNPTIHCHQLFKLTRDKTWVNTNLKSAYFNLPHIPQQKTRAL